MAAKRKASVLLHKEPPLPTAPVPDTASDVNPDDPYAGLMKDADKLKLMLLAWNYQNSNAVRNGTEGPDLGVVGGLWAQYQNALAQNVTKMESSISPIPRAEESSPMETQDETNSSGQKDEDEGSEDDSDDKLDTQAHDPERLKAFNMFVRLFVDENLDRIIPISKQPKEKIQAIIDSCARQFPEFSERSRKRIRTYLKSCRRNKKAREGWDNTTRPTPAHLTSVQAEQILAIACENESMNAKRMRIGLDPITQAIPLTSSTSSTSTAVTSDAPSTSTTFSSGFRSTPNPATSETDIMAPITTSTQGASSSARSSPLALSTTSVGGGNQPLIGAGTTLSNGNTTVTSVGGPVPASSPIYRPTDFTSPSSTSPYARTPAYPSYFPAANATPTDLSMKPSTVQQPTQSTTSTAAATSSSLSPNARPPPPLVTHKLSANEITAARQVITAYRESAAFLLRTADQVEQLLVQQQ
ncbi:nucleolar protein 4-like isoform X2 [Episyrphus balteatus]|uniref:nucleolar protein 4-like isoform X2 n=1 Tax=Episyrphus balteatus TaxID=286459 RepID=UPI0024854972|nr:nucleolar protein 4-like isoform X2 [Episyrphus balteatus]